MVPVELRPAIRHELDRLVGGELPELLVWVHTYGEAGAVLVPQPDDVWEHEASEATRRDDGGWHVVVPLFTEAESPSVLSAEIVVDVRGAATIHDVHVL